MGEKTHQEEEPALEPDELEQQDGELLPDREALSVLDGPLKGPMPLPEVSE
jgi:hypothetical protein